MDVVPSIQALLRSRESQNSQMELSGSIQLLHAFHTHNSKQKTKEKL